MIPVKRPDVADAKWQSWRDQAKKTMDGLVTQYKLGDDIKLREDMYKEAMPFLLELFHGKCAYCETVISSNQPGDVEHYRPKGRIRDRTGAVIKVRIQDKEVEHPGYWWLAYDWSNLLPSCIDCNRRRKHGDDSVPLGKAEYFDVRGTRAEKPGDKLAEEQALLLDPSTDGFDPAQHFEFIEDGKIKPKTDEARYSCELLGLNLREKLVAQRAKAYLHAQLAFTVFLSQAFTAPAALLEPVRGELNDMWEGRGAYSAFARQALDAARSKVALKGLLVNFPIPPLATTGEG